MPLYEHVFIARQDISPQQVDAMTEQFKGLIQSMDGAVGKTEYWGLKNFAYRMKRYRKGHYVLMNVDAPPAALKELERQQHIHEDVLRSLTIRVDELETEPSAMMQSRARDDRGRGRDRDHRDRDRGDRDRGRDRDRDRGDRGDRPFHHRDEGESPRRNADAGRPSADE